MKPQVGNIVLYKNTEAERKFQNDAAVIPAVIVRVINDTTVNLTLLQDASETTRRRTSVLIGAHDGQWSWPPAAAETASA